MSQCSQNFYVQEIFVAVLNVVDDISEEKRDQVLVNFNDITIILLLVSVLLFLSVAFHFK